MRMTRRSFVSDFDGKSRSESLGVDVPSEHRNNTTLAISSGFPIRPIGSEAIIASSLIEPPSITRQWPHLDRARFC
jgi:hypothetical protein